jgi:hypothetical protein
MGRGVRFSRAQARDRLIVDPDEAVFDELEFFAEKQAHILYDGIHEGNSHIRRGQD